MTISIKITNNDSEPKRAIEVYTPQGNRIVKCQETIDTYLYKGFDIFIRELDVSSPQSPF